MTGALHEAAMQMQRTAAAILAYLDKPDDEKRMFVMQVERTNLEEAMERL